MGNRRGLIAAAVMALGIVALIVVMAVAGDDSEPDAAPRATTRTSTSSTSTSTSTSTTTTTVPPTSSTTVAAPPAVDREMVAVATVQAAIQQWLDDAFARTGPAFGIEGPSQVHCDDTGVVPVGGVVACLSVQNERDTIQLESPGLVVYVLDSDGRAAWSIGTDIPSTTAGLLFAYDRTPHGLFCRDLLTEGVAPHPFSLANTSEQNAYLWSLIYWSLEGEPDRMDADRNGIPCETLYDPAVVAFVLAGGPV